MAGMLPPGLLPDSNEPRRSPSTWMAAAVVLTAFLALFGMLIQVRRLTRERDGHFLARLGPPPDGHGGVGLHDHVVGENRR